jgi:predicted permease
MGTWWQDCRHGLRGWARSPGFAAVAVLSLALGIGANTAIFSLLNGLVLKPLPVRRPQDLRVLGWAGYNVSIGNFSGSGNKTRDGRRSSWSFSYPAYCDFRDQAQGFSHVFAFSELGDLTVIANGVASTAWGMMVSGNFFDGYGARPLLGRAISPEDDRPNAEPVAMITHRFWQRHFGLDPEILGKELILNKTSFSVIAVLPRSYAGPTTGDMPDIYVPLAVQPLLNSDNPLASQRHWWLQIMGRLSPQANETQVCASLEVLFHRALAVSGGRMDQPAILLEDGSRGVLRERQIMARPIGMLLALVGLVLVIACANVAGMLLARGATQRHEMAVRAALGAGRWRLIRQSLMDSLLLALTAGALGLVLSTWIKAAILSFLIRLLPDLRLHVPLDGTVLLFTLAISVLSALLFGLLPAWRVSRTNPAAGLGNPRVQGALHLRAGKILVAAQVALSLLLVAVAGLLVRSFVNLQKTDPGFNIENLLVFSLHADEAGYDKDKCTRFYEEARRSLAALPGVRTVALSHVSLLTGGVSSSGFSLPGRPAPPEQHLSAHELHVSDGFFATMGIPLRQGCDFNPTDTGTSTPVMIVNEAFQREFLPHEEALGQLVQKGRREYQIIGVCADAKYASVRGRMMPTMYLPRTQTAMSQACFQVRTALPPLSLAPAVRKIVAGLDENIPVRGLTTQADLFARSISLEQLCTILCGSLAILAVLLVCLGLYGLMAYNVARRTGEIGIRMALGARAQDVAGPIVRQALGLTGIGIVVGLPVVLLAVPVLRSVVYGVTPHDPVTIVGAVILLLTVAAGAAWWPACRAARTDPMVALRYE